MILVPAARGNKEVGFSKPHGDKFALLSRSQHPFIVYSVKLCTKMSRACLFWRNSGIINDFRPPQTVSGHCGRDHPIFQTMVTEHYRNFQKCYLIRNIYPKSFLPVNRYNLRIVCHHKKAVRSGWQSLHVKKFMIGVAPLHVQG